MLGAGLVLHIIVEIREEDAPTIESIVGAGRQGQYSLQCLVVTPDEELCAFDVWS